MFGEDDLSDHGGSTIVHHTNNPGISSSDDIVQRNTDQPDRPRAKGRGSQCGTPPSGSGFFLTGKFDSILHRTDSPVNDLWVNLPVVNSWTSLPVIYVLPDRADRNSSLQTGLPVHYLPGEPDGTKVTDHIHGTGWDRNGPNWVSISRRVHGTVELSTGQRTLDKSTGQLKLSSVQHGRIPMGQRSSTEQSTTIRYMGHSSGRGPTVTSSNRYSTGPDQTNSSDYRKIGYRTDNVPDRTGHNGSVVSRDRSKSTDHPSRLDGQGFRIPLRNSSPNNRSPSFSSPSRRSRRKHRSEKKKKRIRHSSSLGSSISSSSSSSRSRSRRHKKRHHRSRFVSRHHRHRHGRKRRRSPSSSSSERRSKKSYNERADAKSVSPVRQSLSPSPSRFTVAHEISLTIGPHDDDFQSPSKSNFKKPHPILQTPSFILM